MPRKRNKHQFRRGSEQKYLRSAIQTPRIRQGNRQVSHAFHMPNWLLMAVTFSIGVVLTVSVLRMNPGQYLSNVDLARMVPNISVPTITLPAISMPKISLPAVELPKISFSVPAMPKLQNPLPAIAIKAPTIPSLTLPRFSFPRFSMPNISINPQPLMRIVASSVRNLSSAGLQVVTLLNPAPFIIASINTTRSFIYTTGNIFLQTVKLLDPRPFWPAIQAGLGSFSQTTYSLATRTVAFVNPLPVLRSVWNIHVVVFEKAVTIVATSMGYTWRGMVIAGQLIIRAGITIGNFLWIITVWIANAVKFVFVSLFQFFRWIIVSIGNAIVRFVQGVINLVKRFVQSTQQAATNVRNFFRPYVIFVAQSFSNAISYLQTSSQESQKMMGGLVNQYEEGMNSMKK